MLFDLEKYKDWGHFFFEPTNRLSEVCNAPTDKSGIYLIYELRKGKVNLIYIGRSGHLRTDGSMFIRKSGIGGLKDRIVNGKTWEKMSRYRAWPLSMVKDNVDALDVYWYVTHCDKYFDCPRVLEKNLLLRYKDKNGGKLPKWNKNV